MFWDFRALRCLGNADYFRPVILDTAYEMRPGDEFLMCTDGFWEYVLENEMEELLSRSASGKEWLQQMEKVVLSRVPENHDNYTAVGIRVMQGLSEE